MPENNSSYRQVLRYLSTRKLVQGGALRSGLQSLRKSYSLSAVLLHLKVIENLLWIAPQVQIQI